MVEHMLPVERLEVNLARHHVVYFEKGKHDLAAAGGKEKWTKLMTWFESNHQHPNSRHIRYVEYPKYFTWNKGARR